MTTPMQDRTLKVLHDRLLAERPEGAVHDEESCPLCAMTDDDGGSNDPMGGGSVSDAAELQAAIDKAVEAAVAAKDARIKELEEAQEVDQHEAALAALRTEKEAEVAELQRQLDEATVTAAAEKERADLIVAWLDEEKEAAEARETAAARRDERLAKVKDAAPVMPQEYLDKHADRFAAMSDEDFELTLDGLRETAAAAGATGSKKTPPAGDTLPAVTGLHASRDETGGHTSAAKALLAARREQGRVDYSTI